MFSRTNFKSTQIKVYVSQPTENLFLDTFTDLKLAIYWKNSECMGIINEYRVAKK